MNPSRYDMILVGSGISCTAVMLHLLDKLKVDGLPGGNPFHIAVIEKDDELWKGIPYGRRSSMNSLTITNFGEFVPNVEKEPFMAWLVKNREQWVENLARTGGPTASKWLDNNLHLIQSGQWDQMYIPRSLFGAYLKEKIEAKIVNAQRNNFAKVTCIRGLAVDINKDERIGYQLKIKNDAGLDSWFETRRMVLCIGSPPIKAISGIGEGGNYTYINDIYHPSLPDNMAIIQSVVSSVTPVADRNILVLGSNASSLELIYLFNTIPELRNSINKIVVLSQSGNLPNRINPFPSNHHAFKNMELLKNKKLFTSADLMQAIEIDIAAAQSNDVNIADVYSQLSELMIELLEKLTDTQKEKFYCFHGAEFSKLIRRAGAEYRDAAAELEQQGKLEMIKGTLLNIGNSQDSGKRGEVLYRPFNNDSEVVFPISFSLVVNCGGFEYLNNYSSSELISNLVVRKLCDINCTVRGFRVNERFEAAEGLYIMGPLLGGIFNDKSKLWHVENAKSIFYLANLMVSEMTFDGINKMIISNVVNKSST